MKEAPLEKNQVQLTENYRVEFDRYNITLLTKFQKREGRGKNADFIDEYGYGYPKYFGIQSTMTSVARNLLNTEFVEYLGKGVSEGEIKNLEQLLKACEDVKLHIDKVAEEIGKNLTDKIEINIETRKRGKAVEEVVEEVVEVEGDDD